ncbi:MAG: calcium/sodium antiporter [Gemmatimonadota bacterium]
MPELFGETLVFAAGILGLTLGADWLVRGGSRIAGRFGIPELVIGLTVVAFGTSAPELVISGGAALRDQPGLAVGNVMGSTVANVGLIVGVGALLRPIEVHRRLLVRESPLLILVLATVMVLSLNDALGRLDGLALLTGFGVYLYFLARWASEGSASVPDPTEDVKADGPGPAWDWTMSLAGLMALVFGAHYALEAGEALARAFGIPEAVIGATMFAVGTSLPELASTVAAAIRGLGDIAIGNVIGSNVFNLGLVLGSAALIRPLQLSPQQVADQVIPALIFCIGLIPIAYTGMRVNRWEGVLLLLAYGGFLYWVLL